MEKKIDINKLVPVISLFVMLLVFTVLTGGTMLSLYNIRMLIDQTVVLIIACCGTIFVISLGSVDLSVGVVCGFSAVIGDLVYRMTGSTVLMILTCLVVGTLVGLLSGFLISICKMPSFMCTLALLIGLRGVINYIQSIVGINYASPGLMNLQKEYIKIPLLLVIIAVSWYIFGYTKFGKHCQAIGENEIVARYVGIPVNKLKIVCYMISGFTAALAGIFMIARLGGTSTTMGTNFEMKVLITIYVGGILVRGGATARSYKVIVGAFVVMIIENGLKIMGYASAEINEAAQGILLMVILFLTMYFENHERKHKNSKRPTSAR